MGNREIAYNLDGKLDFIYSEMMEKFEALSDHVKRLDCQVANNAVNLRREKGFRPVRTDINPKSQVNAVTLRSGRHLTQNVKEGITIDEFVGIQHAEKDDSHPILVDTPEYSTIIFLETKDTDQAVELEEQNSDLSENEVQSENEESFARHQHSLDRHTQGVNCHPRVLDRHPVIPDPQIYKSSEPVPPKVYVPKTPFPQSQSKIFDKIIVKIPLGDAIKISPAINKYLKDAATKGFETTEHHIMMRSLCDLGSSVNLIRYSVTKALGLTEFKPTRITLILADRSVRVPEGILEDVPIKKNDYVIPADFVVLKYEKEPKDPLILGRPFLETAGEIIAVKKGRICLNIRDIAMSFDMEKLVKKPLIDGQTYSVDYLSELADESFMDISLNDPLERTLTTHEEEIFSKDDRADECARFLDVAEGVMNIDAVKI
ncbi:hypothetical protein N665_0110s0011 [Sinapis alba]|nr:hypothetical protein N665_0110s0011 [Sinapis alba]